MNLLTPSSKILKKANWDLFAIVSHIMATFGIMELSLKLGIFYFSLDREDPTHINADTKAKGDNDPLDVCEIGELVGYPGYLPY